MLVPSVAKAALRSGCGQTWVDATRVACAIERYRLVEGRLPPTLDQLVPRWLDRIPTDVVDGRPLRYRIRPEGGYILYAVGWNGTDDGGTAAAGKGKSSRVNLEAGDWVWMLPR
jgi:hypothetical protein